MKSAHSVYSCTVRRLEQHQNPLCHRGVTASRRPLVPCTVIRGSTSHGICSTASSGNGFVHDAGDPDEYHLPKTKQEQAHSPQPGTAAASTHKRVHWLLRPFVLALVESARAVQITLGAAAALLLETFARIYNKVFGRGDAHPRAARVVQEAKGRWQSSTADMPHGFWSRVQWLWDCPPVKRVRITATMAQWSVRIPAIIALLATQGSLLASSFSLPMLAPLLIGTGIALKSIQANASFLFPRIGLMVILTWGLWFANRVVANSALYLRRQGAIDETLKGNIITVSECAAMTASLTILLSMLGLDLARLLAPAGFACAYAAKDLLHNFLAGFFLFAVQPFKLGDRVAVSPPAGPPNSSPSWFEGICEKVDLRYTVVRSGQRRLYVPNAAFLTREFLVVDDPEADERKRSLEGPVMAPSPHAYVQGPDGHPRWMPVQPFDGYSHYMVDPRHSGMQPGMPLQPPPMSQPPPASQPQPSQAQPSSAPAASQPSPSSPTAPPQASHPLPRGPLSSNVVPRRSTSSPPALAPSVPDLPRFFDDAPQPAVPPASLAPQASSHMQQSGSYSADPPDPGPQLQAATPEGGPAPVGHLQQDGANVQYSAYGAPGVYWGGGVQYAGPYCAWPYWPGAQQ